MELQDYWRIVRKSWMMIVAITLTVMAAVAAYTLTRTPEYKSTTELYISVRANEGTLGEMQQGSGYARSAIDSYADVVSTSIITEKVAEELGGSFSASEVEKRVSASAVKDTVLMNISATDSDPDVAAEIANVTGRVFSDVVTNQLEKPAEGSPTRVVIDTVEPAQVPAAPESPNPKRNMALGLLLGLALGLGVAVLVDVLDTRVRTRRDITDITTTPILGQLAYDPDSDVRPLLVQDDPLSPRAEAFRALRTNLQFLRVEGNPHSFVITSTGPSEGKSTTAANLAITLAQSGASVCLVDGDLRKPRMATLFGIEGGVGLTEVIIGRSSLESVMQPWGKNDLVLLPAGHRPPNPSELLGSQEMADILSALQRQYDYVIVDAPPILTVTDAAIVAKHVGGVLMVAAVGEARKDAVEMAIETLDHIQARLLGIVLTKVPEKGPDSYYYAAYYSEELRGKGNSGRGAAGKTSARGIWKTPKPAPSKPSSGTIVPPQE